jgi:hypothetical protein
MLGFLLYRYGQSIPYQKCKVYRNHCEWLLFAGAGYFPDALATIVDVMTEKAMEIFEKSYCNISSS